MLTPPTPYLPQFHPKEDLVASASLDQTIRVWDISSLRRKAPRPSQRKEEEAFPGLNALNQELFGSGDGMVKYVLEGHERGVNWVSFHPTLPLIVSGADDRQVKLWRMNDSKAWEVDTLRGHQNNVSCVMFHPKQDVIISNSEDRTVRVWDMSKRTGIQAFRRYHYRFWVLGIHPHINLVAAGHDAGLLVFKLERERPAHAHVDHSLFYVYEKYLRRYDYATKRSKPLLALSSRVHGLNSAPRGMQYNSAENAVLLTGVGGSEAPSYELYVLPRTMVGATATATATSGTGGAAMASVASSAVEPRVGTGAAACFVARNRFAVLDKVGSVILVKNMMDETTKKIPVSSGVETMYPAGSGHVLLRTEDRVQLFDLQKRGVVGDLAVPAVKYVVWSADYTMMAMFSKHCIILADRGLTTSVTVHETIRIKSAVFDPHGVLIYTTLNHVKYALPNGDSGTLRSLDDPVYLTAITTTGNTGAAAAAAAHALDRSGRLVQIPLSTSEYLFKLYLARKDHPKVMALMRTGQVQGDAIIEYLQKRGFPQVALHMVQDPRKRFDLAVGSGNLEVALDMAEQLAGHGGDGDES